MRPGRDEFLALSDEHTVVPVWREVLADLETPVSAFLKLVGDSPGFLLESVEHGERWGRYSFVGRDPVLTMVVRDGTVTWEGEPPAGVPTDRGALGALEALLSRFRAPVLDGLPPFHGGIVGFLGYDVVREIEHLPDVPADDSGSPDAVMAVPGHVAAFDHFAQRLYLVENVFVDPEEGEAERAGAYDAAVARLAASVDDLARPLAYVPEAPPDARFSSARAELPPFRVNRTSDDFRRAVEVAREHVLAGDVFQVVLSQRFDVDLDGDLFDVYRVLRQLNPSPYMYFLRHPEMTIAGSSPEPLVQVVDGRVVSRPIAGTRWRGASEEHDRRLAAELAEHPKERAEHVMLVDLARNDIGRVVEFGTLGTDELMTVERYSHVMHLTSQVSGSLAAGRGPVDVLRATFPAGTVSGAPKVRAMEIIDELEPTKRGPYAGVVGYVDFSGNLDTAIAIRTMTCREGVASVQAGAGVVVDSDPADEDLECHNKARALLAAVAAAQRRRAPAPPASSGSSTSPTSPTSTGGVGGSP